jgi:hypothetical protein
MTGQRIITVRRALREDVPAIASGIGQPGVDDAAVMHWLLERGLLVAEQEGRMLGVAGWQVENLVAVVDLLYLVGEDQWPVAGALLLQAMETAAGDLMCEVAVLALPEALPPQAAQALHKLGYAQQDWATLHRYWREVLASFGMQEGPVWAHRLRERMVMRPM